ncbi:endonuclease/exonuclease/phosphatase family protein [Tamlana sp. 2_MG-2023]|uniref:endonuclease/exonuclease/phosphatase family protein n=1 Tax=unclassified Tamlana TaxID=2614803 RepID=UPI0026E34866|nr:MULTISPECIES: endonuclease/exonuclease/phosphatase family protein [unclassified Tamlana]MDO6758990.1 endonuclease/exonuclease/phosphatase family protein [Tamlana sp. 2_MG-2023]MDO6789689.1 endonuclease/exonuclease/phosphatase family protein [Tamlana sp. 1_MG-2023]
MNFIKKFFLGLSRLVYFLVPISLIFACFVTLCYENVLSLVLSVGLPGIVVLNVIIFIYLALRKRKQAVFVLLALVVYGFTHVSFFKFNFNFNENVELVDTMSILTFNVRSAGGAGHTSDRDRDQRKVRIETMSAFVKNQNADIVMFQEFWSADVKDFPNYPYTFLGQRKGIGKSIQVILSKFPIVNKGYVDFPNTANNAMYADIQYKNEIIRVYSIHLQSFSVEIDSNFFTENGLKAVYPKIDKGQKMKSAQTELLQESFQEFNGRSIVCGDFNATPFSKTYKTISKDRQDSFLEAGSGFGETYNLLGYPMRLDYILPDANFEVIAHKNFNLKLSDHEPILVYLKLKTVHDIRS